LLTYFAFNLMAAVIVSKFQEAHAGATKALTTRPAGAVQRSRFQKFLSFLSSCVAYIAQSLSAPRVPGLVKLTRGRSKYFRFAFLLLVLVDMATMAATQQPSPIGLETALQVLNVIFVCFYVGFTLLELLIGSKKPGWLAFQLLVVLFCCVDIIVTLSSPGSRTAVTRLRPLRLLLIFRALKLWTAARVVIKTAISAISATFFVTIIVFCTIFLFALVGRGVMYQSFTLNGVVRGADTVEFAFV
jgi:hypothetical protein